MIAVRLSLAALAVVSLAGAASAETRRDRQERACQADVYRLCKDEVPDEDRIAACLGVHRSDLSVNCGILYDAGGKQ